MSIELTASSVYLRRTTDLPTYNQPNTWAGWVNFISNFVGSGYNSVVNWSENDSTSNCEGLDINNNGSNNRLLLFAERAGYQEARGATNIATNTWHFLAFVRTASPATGGSQLIAYLDGVQEATLSYPTANYSAAVGFLQCGILQSTDPCNARYGSMYLWSGLALSQAQIVQQMGQRLPFFTVSQYAFWPMFAGTQRNLDISGAGRNWTVAGTPTDADDPPVPWSLPFQISMYPASAATDYPRSFSSTVSHTAGVARATAAGRPIASTVSHSPALARAVANTRPVTSSISATAAVDRIFGAARAPASTINHSADLARAVAVTRTLTLGISHGAAFVRLVDAPRSVASTIAHSASLARNNAVTRPLTSIVAHSAALDRAIDFMRSLASSISPADSWARTLTNVRPLSSTILHSGEVDTGGAKSRSILSSVAHAGTLGRSQALARTLGVSVGNTALVGVGVILNITSSIAHSATVGRQLALSRTLVLSIGNSILIVRAVVVVRTIASSIGSTITLLALASNLTSPIPGRTVDVDPEPRGLEVDAAPRGFMA